jgi:putative ABC transport system permease protein
MKFLPLIWAGVWRRPGRAALTMVSMVSAFVLFGVLQGFSSGLSKLIADSHADMLAVRSQVSFIDPLPISMSRDIAAIPGVKVVSRLLFFGGPFRSPNEFLPANAVNPDEAHALDDQLRVTPEEWAALKRTRSGALISADFAKLYGIKVGDRIPLRPQYFSNRNGSNLWPVDIVGIYPANPDDAIFGRDVILNYDYVDQSRSSGAGTVNEFGVLIDDPGKSGQISAAIDRMTANSGHATRTFSQKQMALAAVSNLGQVGLAVQLIMGAVFFALLFSVGAVMLQSARERTSEFAVLKTLGFGDAGLLALILSETMIFCLVAAGIGLTVSLSLYPVVLKTINFNGLPAGSMMPVGFAAAALLAVITAAVAAWRTARLSIVDALAER